MTLTSLEKAAFFSLGLAFLVGIFLLFVQHNVIVKKNALVEMAIKEISRMTPREAPEKTEKIPGDLDDANKININFASVEQVDAIPGVGKVTAERIVEFVQGKGKIESISDLSAVQGMTPKKLSTLRQYICITGGIKSASEMKKLNLNFATEAEIEKLPGVGPGLARSIVETRNIKGSFRSLDDLQEVPGLSEKTFRKFEPMVEVR